MSLLPTLRIVAAMAAGIVVLMLAFVVLESLPALRSVGAVRFFADPGWHPAAGAARGQFNLGPMLVGTIAAAAGAVVLAAPLGLGSAIFSRFYAPGPIGRGYRRLVEVLAGIPSVVYGFWGLVVLAPLIRQWQPPGQSLLAGTLILALMILPTVALLSEASLRSVPASYLRGTAALGLSRWASIRGVVLPAARSGILAAILLATGRAIGETMAVLMVTGNVVQVPRSVFDPVRALTSNIALELGYAMDHHRSALFVSGLVLMAMIAVLVAMAEWTGRERLHA
ncbi:MAG: phosphate ABC transporter permease subunit PstC [Pseudomonadota bacterium]|nr:phosphate ABC transporter permease subunit PstC [Pseudomonadota bacterium]